MSNASFNTICVKDKKISEGAKLMGIFSAYAVRGFGDSMYPALSSSRIKV